MLWLRLAVIGNRLKTRSGRVEVGTHGERREIAISEQRFFEVWIFTGMMYFVVCFACAWAFGRLEARMGAHLR